MRRLQPGPWTLAFGRCVLSLGPERLARRENLLRRRRRNRTREEVPLRACASKALQFPPLYFALDSFGDDAGIHRTAKGENTFNDRRPVRKEQTLDERPVDLERVHRQPVQVTQRRVAGAEVVQIDLDAELAKLLQQSRGGCGIVHEGGFGDLESEFTRLKPRFIDGLLHEHEEVLLHQLTAGHVDGDALQLHVRVSPTPLRKRFARLPQSPGPDWLDETQFLGNWDERGGRHGLTISRPADQRLESDTHP